MRTTRLWCWNVVVVGLGVLLIASPDRLGSQQSRGAVRID